MIIKNCRIFNGLEFLKGLNDILIKNNKIIAIGNNLKNIKNQEIVDIDGNFAVPGYIDIHTHGINGIDFSTSDNYSTDELFDFYISKGTTSIYLTSVTMKTDDINRLLQKFSKINHSAFVGVHLEGPYLNTSKLGAHKKEFVIEPSISSYQQIVGKYHDIVKRVTIACELDKNYSLSKYLIKNGVVVSFGHTICNAEDSYKAFENGYTLSTHHFNAMPLMHHREVSITGTSLLNDNVKCEYIPDFYHVSKEMLNILFKCKPEDNLVMVTDSISATCLEDGQYSLGGLSVSVHNGLVTDKSGTIAGSSITMAEGVFRMINNGFNKSSVLKSATSNPANVMSLKNKGFLKEGYDADINILEKNFKYNYTIFQGKLFNY